MYLLHHVSRCMHVTMIISVPAITIVKKRNVYFPKLMQAGD